MYCIYVCMYVHTHAAEHLYCATQVPLKLATDIVLKYDIVGQLYTKYVNTYQTLRQTTWNLIFANSQRTTLYFQTLPLSWPYISLNNSIRRHKSVIFRNSGNHQLTMDVTQWSIVQKTSTGSQFSIEAGHKEKLSCLNATQSEIIHTTLCSQHHVLVT